MTRNPICRLRSACENVVQRLAIKWVALVFVVWFHTILAAESPKVAWIQLATRAHAAAEDAFRSNQTDRVSTWQLARACYDLAEFASTDEQRAKLAQQGISACRDSLKSDPAEGKIIYYLAMNLGQLARTKTLGALRIVKEMEELFEKARVLDESFDHGGPDRCLGLLYLEAPGWPTSIGNRKKAVIHFRRATEVSPTYPENRLLLVKSLILTHDHAGAGKEWAVAQESWTRVESEFAGPTWEPALADWDSMRVWIQRKLEPKAPPR